jgi:acyl-CoA synthetase (AMP-forming)/AMP-acid ligase II
LQSRSYKIAYALLNKLSKHGGGGVVGSGTAELLGSSSVKPGDRVALVYPNSDAIGFICAFYGCLHAGVVPVPIEVPLTRRDAGSQQIGFLLGSCGVQVALTSDICLKGLPKTASSGEVIAFKGWPKLHWCVTDNLIKPPKDWQPPPKLQDDTPAYIEVLVAGPLLFSNQLLPLYITTQSSKWMEYANLSHFVFLFLSIKPIRKDR